MTVTPLPFRPGSDDSFAAIRNLLLDSGYTPDGICARYEIPDIHQFRTYVEGRRSHLEIESALDVLVRLFMDGLAVSQDTVREHLTPAGLEALLSLRLLDVHPQAPDRLAATVQLYPSGSVFIASDLEDSAPGIASGEELEPPDHVFSANTTLTGTFLSQLPDAHCERFLELCAGTGVAALLAAGSCGHATATDITDRSTRFAEFNARLNGIRNFTALEGDLYEPVRGRTFDRIVAHPPYVPAAEVRMIYRDGGEDGETILRGILAGLPEYLAPGGRFYCTCIATDRKEAPLEDRLRAMLGRSGTEFDLLLVAHETFPPGEYYGRLAAARRITFDIADERLRLFETLEAENVVYCSFVLRRDADGRAPVTMRRAKGTGSGAKEADRLLDWGVWIARAGDSRALLGSRPRLSPAARLEVVHRVDGDEWKIDAGRLVVDHPFARTVEGVSSNLATLLTMFDGQRTVGEILEHLLAGGAVPANAPENAFTDFVREFVSEGVLLVDLSEIG